MAERRAKKGAAKAASKSGLSKIRGVARDPEVAVPAWEAFAKVTSNV